MQTSPGDPRVVLGLSGHETPAQARAAFRRLAKAAHPDSGGDARWFAAVVDAYRELCARLGRDRASPRAAAAYDLHPVPVPTRSWYDCERPRTVPRRPSFEEVLAQERRRSAA
jgi:hypothetical protein